MGTCHSKYTLIRKNDLIKIKLDQIENQLIHLTNKQLNFNIDITKFNNNIENIIFYGGGIKCISYCGAIDELYLQNYLNNIKKYCGISIGSIFAVLLAIGYTTSEILDIITKTNFKNFITDSNHNIRDFYSLLDNLGYCTGDYFYEWIGNLIKNKTNNINYTFRNLWNDKNIELLILSTNLNTNKCYTFSYKNTPEMYIRDSIRIAISIPIIFKPIIWDNKILVDGSINDLNPIHLFDIDNTNNSTYNYNTICIKTNLTNYNSNNEIIDLKSLLYNLINILYEKSNDINITENDLLRTVIINTDNINTNYFELTVNEKNKLIMQGKLAIQHFLKKRDQL